MGGTSSALTAAGSAVASGCVEAVAVVAAALRLELDEAEYGFGSGKSPGSPPGKPSRLSSSKPLSRKRTHGRSV